VLRLTSDSRPISRCDFSSLAYLALGWVSGVSARIASEAASPTMGAGPAIWGTGMSRFTLTRRGGLETQDRSRQFAKGFAYASFTVAMLGAMHGFGQFTSWVWLGAALLALGAVATWTIGHRAQYAGPGLGRTSPDDGIGNGKG
jgi:hypothetical protein